MDGHAEMMLFGNYCEACGVYMGGGPGYPQRCAGCHHEITTDELEQEFEQN